MKSFGSYISKYLVSFVAFILILLFLNAVVFGLTFQKIVTEDYGDSSPQAMLEMTATAATPEQLSDEAVQMLRQNHIWAIYLNTDGQCYWSVDLPDNVPKNYTIQDVALFSKGYIEDYPVFIWNTDDGLLVLGYPTDSYTTNNYILPNSRKLRIGKRLSFTVGNHILRYGICFCFPQTVHQTLRNGNIPFSCLCL